MGASFVFATANITQPKEYWQNYLGEMDDGQMQSFIDYSDEMFNWEDALDPFSAQDVAERVSEAIEVAYDDFRSRCRRQRAHTLYLLWRSLGR